MDALFEKFFMEAFLQSEHEGTIDRGTLNSLINDKFQDDAHLQEVMTSELEKVVDPEAGENQQVSDTVVRTAIHNIMCN